MTRPPCATSRAQRLSLSSLWNWLAVKIGYSPRSARIVPYADSGESASSTSMPTSARISEQTRELNTHVPVQLLLSSLLAMPYVQLVGAVWLQDTDLCAAARAIFQVTRLKRAACEVRHQKRTQPRAKPTCVEGP